PSSSAGVWAVGEARWQTSQRMEIDSMRAKRWFGLGLGLAALAGQAWADDGHSGNPQAPSYMIYPKGAEIKQEYTKPAEGSDNNLVGFAAAPGAVSHGASASVVSVQPTLLEAELTALPGDVSAIPLGVADPGEAGIAASAPRAAW